MSTEVYFALSKYHEHALKDITVSWTWPRFFCFCREHTFDRLVVWWGYLYPLETLNSSQKNQNIIVHLQQKAPVDRKHQLVTAISEVVCSRWERDAADTGF